MVRLKIEAVTATVMVVLYALWTPAFLLTGALNGDGSGEGLVGNDGYALGQLVEFLATALIFGTWIYDAGKRLHEAGTRGLEFSPASRVWWFFVPIACLFKPFQGMRELWNASHGRPDSTDTNPLIGSWWALWLGRSLTAYLVGLFGGSWLWVDAAVKLALAATALTVVWRITRAQTGLEPDSLADVFA